jgi:rhodanese-related sulfurtransferase
LTGSFVGLFFRTKFIEMEELDRILTIKEETGSEEENVRQNKPLIIDCRRQDEYEYSHLDNAINLHSWTMNTEKLKEALKGIPKDRPIITYCAIGLRSGR